MRVQPYEKDQAGSSTLEILTESIRYNFYIANKIKPYLGAKNLEIGAGIGTISSIVSKWVSVHLCEASSHNIKLLKEKFAGDSNILSYSKDLFTLKLPASFGSIYFYECFRALPG